MSASDSIDNRQKNAHEFLQLGSGAAAALAVLALGLMLLTILARGERQGQVEAPLSAEQVQAVISSAAD